MLQQGRAPWRATRTTLGQQLGGLQPVANPDHAACLSSYRVQHPLRGSKRKWQETQQQMPERDPGQPAPTLTQRPWQRLMEKKGGRLRADVEPECPRLREKMMYLKEAARTEGESQAVRTEDEAAPEKDVPELPGTFDPRFAGRKEASPEQAGQE